jgi:3-oxoacyl-[acyl-carrier-protein] synthase II
MKAVRAVVTGMGLVTPLGCNLDEYFQNLLDGKSGVSLVTKFDISEYPTKIAAEIKDFDGSKFLDKKEIRRLDLSEQYAVAASQMALDDSGLNLDSIDKDRAGVVIGSGIGGITTFEKQHELLLKSGPGRISPFFIPMMIIDMCAGLVSMRFDFRGPNYGTVSACASSSHAIYDAFRIIQRGEADIMIAGGAESTITPTSMAGFCSAKAMSTRNDEPERACRPFDKDRDGFVMGEGSGILVLESLESAQARGAKIYCEIIGGGMSCDAHHVTAPLPDGRGARMAMINALKDAELAPDQVDYINSHGTATILGDTSETKAIKAVFGERAYKIPVNSTKSETGHLLGSAGAVELITSILSLQASKLHPTINLDEPDPECDLDYVPHRAREFEFDIFLTNSFGFGGHNITLVGRRFDNHT